MKQKKGYINGLKLDNKGIYIYRFMFNGQVYTGSTGQRRLFEAERELTRVRAEAQQTALGTAKKKPLTFKQAFELWQKAKSGVCCQDYMKNNLRLMELHFYPTIGHLFLEKLTKEHLQECLNAYLEKTQSDKTVINYGGYNLLIRVLKAIFSVLREAKHICPTAKEVPAKETSQKRKKAVVTLKDLPVFLSHVEKRYGLTKTVGIAMGIYLGLRVSEICSARWDMVDYTTKRFNNISTDRDSTKGKEASDIPICDELLGYFDRINPNRDKLGLILLNGAIPFKRTFLTQILETTGSTLKLGHLSAHSLRRSFITILHNKGVALETLKGLARHAKIEQTLEYVQVGVKEREEAINRVFNVS